jgi:hypothetical protein
MRHSRLGRGSDKSRHLPPPSTVKVTKLHNPRIVVEMICGPTPQTLASLRWSEQGNDSCAGGTQPLRGWATIHT